MEKTSLTWVNFYKLLATELLNYKNNREVLIEKLKNIYEDLEMRFPKMEADGTVTDIDPFTVFALFNKGITENNRKNILSGISNRFGISENIPSDFDGIPVMNNQKATFFYFKDDRRPEDLDNLWDIFEAALNYSTRKTNESRAKFINCFDKVLTNKGVRWNLTMGLFWIRPDDYINLDSKNRDFILAEQMLPEDIVSEVNSFKDIPDGELYLQICDAVQNEINKSTNEYTSFADFSSAAWKTTREKTPDEVIDKETKEEEYWPSLDEYNPNLTAEDWIAFLQEDRKPYPSTLKMLRAMIELGGEATCKSIGELLGEHASSWVSRGNNLGYRMKKKHNLPPCMDGDKERYFPIAFFGRNVYENGKKHYAWKLRPELKQAVESMFEEKEGQIEEMKTDIGKNTILYGPPGTGKTYNTVVYAVAIIENKKLQTVKDEDYNDVLARYNAYKAEGLIEFTTFHQSYGYEEFIEGIRPYVGEEDEQQEIRYQITSGLFKVFCEKAVRPVIKQQKREIELNATPTIWKVSLEGTGDNPTRKECMENNHIRIGYDSYGGNITSETVFDKGGKNIVPAFVYKMKPGDIILSCYSASTIDAIGVVTGDYEWHDEYAHYKRLRKVDWLVKGINENIIEINNGTTFTLPAVYKLNINLSDVMDIVYKYSQAGKETTENKKNYVFIIDEINRGNISKIFGELITLIETTKRAGQIEEMKVRLPYSQQLFGVPDNIYLIGTMNTADRSIATIDTALRRRFKFREMQPDSDVLEGIYIDEISIKDMFERINKRIEVLFDREHTLGHAYFLPLRTEPTFEKLSEIFKNNIIPLLQEYFFEDYEKIRLVLGDNNKPNKEDQFIKEVNHNYGELFGVTEFDFDDNKVYEVNEEALENIEAYRLI